MKSKLVILSLLLAGAASTVSAQSSCCETQSDSGRGYYSELKNNFFVSIGGGIQASANPDSKFGNTITPLVNVSLGKYITPVWAVRGQVYGWKSQQRTAYPFLNGNKALSKVSENYVGVNLDGIVNLTNLFCGYKPNRVFEGILFVGPSVNFAKNYGSWDTTNDLSTGEITSATPNGHALRALVGASVGLGAKFYVTNSLSIDLEARGQVTPSILGSLSSGKTDGYVYLSAGVSYTFGGRKFIKNKCNHKPVAESVREVVVEKPVEKIVEKEVVKEQKVASPLAVFFKIGSAKIDDYGKVNIGLVAKAIKATPGTVYKVSGYCDIATGSTNSNKVLSEKRAQAVYEALLAEGVDGSQIELAGFGGTTNMFGQDYLNRVVLIEAK